MSIFVRNAKVESRDFLLLSRGACIISKHWNLGEEKYQIEKAANVSGGQVLNIVAGIWNGVLWS